MRKVIFTSLVLAVIVFCAGCQSETASPPQQEDVLNTYHQYIDQASYYKAYRVLAEVLERLEDEPEGVAGLEYQRLVGTCSAMGQSQWAEILQDPEIKEDFKLDLVREIHAMAIKD